MAFPSDLVVAVIVVDAADRLSGDQLHALRAELNASRRARNPQREHFSKAGKLPQACCVRLQICQTRLGRNLRG
jgi:hypothetical protein